MKVVSFVVQEVNRGERKVGKEKKIYNSQINLLENSSGASCNTVWTWVRERKTGGFFGQILTLRFSRNFLNWSLLFFIPG